MNCAIYKYTEIASWFHCGGHHILLYMSATKNGGYIFVSSLKIECVCCQKSPYNQVNHGY